MQKFTMLNLLFLFILAISTSAVQADTELSERERAILETRLIQTVDLDSSALAVRRDAPYTEDGKAGPLLDVYYSAKKEAKARPIILYLHGGPLTPESFSEAVAYPKNWRFFRDYSELAVANGFVAVVPNYRYASAANIELSFSDLKAVLGWLREHAGEFGGDANRVGIWLFSGAGVHLGWLAEESPSAVLAAAAYYPVLNFATLGSSGTKTPAEIAKRWDPVARIQPDMPPLLIARAGRASDDLNASIDSFVRAATTSGATLDLLLHPDGHYGFDVRDDVPRSHELIEQTLAFFGRHLR